MDDENLPPSRRREILHQRKVAKPLMEKRRRERINNCLDQLKSLLTEVTKKADDDDDEEKEENPYRSKLEKADILEMTVNYLKSVKRQKLMMGTNSPSVDPAAASIQSRYEAGFRECSQQVAKYLENANGLSPTTRSTILQHLTRRLQQSRHTNHPTRTTSSPSLPPHPQLLIPPASSGPAVGCVVQTPSYVLSESVNSSSASIVSHPIQLLPVKLATGETVFVVANANDLLLRHQQVLDEQPTTGGRRHLNDEDATNPMHSVDAKNNGIVMYEAISPIPETVSPLQPSRQNIQTNHLVMPLSSSSTSSFDIHGKLQTTKYPPLVKDHRPPTHWNLVFNNSASELAVEPKCPAWSSGECSSSIINGLPLPLSQVVTNSYQLNDDQSHVWRPW